MPSDRGARQLAGLYQLEDSQWWPVERLREYQLGQLGILFAHAYATVPYQRERLRAIGYQSGIKVTEALWDRVPLLERQDVQEAQDKLNSNRLPEGHGPTSDISTSGSTGVPIKVKVTEVTGHFWCLSNLRNHLWQGWDGRLKLAAIRYDRDGKAGYPKGLGSRSWHSHTKDAIPTGPSALLDITTSVEKQIEWLQRQKADYLLTYPSNLAEIIRLCKDKNEVMPDLKGVQTVSEILPQSVREACREAWGLKINDIYSAQEAGYLALQCPESERYHVQSENVLVEVIDDEGKPCAPGEIGRVVITDLHNFATPLIRYVIGDYAEVGAPCACGRGLPVLNRIMGRGRSMVTLPTGERHWPFWDHDGMRNAAPITQLQIVQKTLETIELRLVAQRKLNKAQESELRKFIQKDFGSAFRVKITYHDEIKRSASGKFEDFKSEV